MYDFRLGKSLYDFRLGKSFLQLFGPLLRKDAIFSVLPCFGVRNIFPVCCTTSGWGLGLGALTVAIDTTTDEGGHWYTSTTALQLVCLDLCVACRSCWNGSARRVVVTADTPRRLWLRGKLGMLGENNSGSLRVRVPPCPVRAVTVLEWPEGVQAGLFEGDRGVAAEQTAGFVEGFIRRLFRLGPRRTGPLWWPDTVKALSFGDDFNQPIASIVWPGSLQQLVFGRSFNQHITGVVWPASLQQVSFGEYFNQPGNTPPVMGRLNLRPNDSCRREVGHATPAMGWLKYSPNESC